MERFAIPCVGAIIRRTVGGRQCILLQTRQKPDGGDTNGKLELPGGKLRAGEDVFSALRREVREETGLQVTRIRGETSCPQGEALSFSPFFSTQSLRTNFPVLIHFFLCEAEGEPLPASEESTDIRWVDVEEVRRLMAEQPERVFSLQHGALRAYLQLL